MSIEKIVETNIIYNKNTSCKEERCKRIDGSVSTVIINNKKNIATKYFPLLYSHVYWIREIFILETLKYSLNPAQAMNFVQPVMYQNKNLRSSDGIYIDYMTIIFPKLNKTLSDTFLCDDRSILHAMIDVLSAIDACHENGIVHRDIKAENVLIRIDVNVNNTDILNPNSVLGTQYCLIDFSHSIRIKNYGIPAIPDYDVVSEGYRAPEIYARIPYDQSIDIFAAGMLFFELVAGERVYNYLKIKNKKNLTQLFTGFLARSEEYISLLYDVYSLKKRNIQNTQFYWSIIIDMIAYDPTRRPTARDVINILKTKLSDTCADLGLNNVAGAIEITETDTKNTLETDTKNTLENTLETNAKNNTKNTEKNPHDLSRELTNEELSVLSMCIRITDSINFKTILNTGNPKILDTDLRLVEMLCKFISAKIITYLNYESITVSISICFLILYEDELSTIEEMVCAFREIYAFETVFTPDEITQIVVNLITWHSSELSVL